MRNLVRIISLAATLLVVAPGCYGYTMQTRAPSDGVQRHGRGSVLFWGLKQVHREAECGPEGVARIKTYQPWWSGIVAVLTFGIATPWRSRYECVQGGSAASPSAPAPAPSGASSPAQ